MTQETDGTRRAVGGQPGEGIAVGEEQLYQDGFKKGEFVFRLGTRESVLRDRPGWVIADGTQTVDLVIDGVNYGKPDLRRRLLMGVEEGTAGWDPGDTGGTDVHDHGFTQPNNHVVTQPTAHVVTDAVISTHVVTAPVLADHAALTAHHHLLPFGKADALAGSLYIYDRDTFGITDPGIGSQSIIAAADAAGANPHMMRSQSVTGGTPNAHTFSTALNITNLNHPLTSGVTLSNNHVGTAVDAHAGGDVLPPTGDNKNPRYLAAWPLLKVYD